jgi:hypothetical protein
LAVEQGADLGHMYTPLRHVQMKNKFRVVRQHSTPPHSSRIDLNLWSLGVARRRTMQNLCFVQIGLKAYLHGRAMPRDAARCRAMPCDAKLCLETQLGLVLTLQLSDAARRPAMPWDTAWIDPNFVARRRATRATRYDLCDVVYRVHKLAMAMGHS